MNATATNILTLHAHPRGLTLKEAAERFGYTVDQLSRATNRPRGDRLHLRADKTARPTRVTENEMQAWIERGTI